MKRIVIFCGVFIVFGCAGVQKGNWMGYGSNEVGFYYYDQQSIARPSKNIVRVSNKIVFTVQGVNTMVERLGKTYENLSYEISLKEINCANKTQRWVSTTPYSEKGGRLHTLSDMEEGWESIPPDTLSYTLFEKACN